MSEDRVDLAAPQGEDESGAVDERPARPRMPRRVLAGLLILVAIGTTQAALTGTPVPRKPTFDEKRYELWATNLYAHGYFGESATTSLARAELRTVPLKAYEPPGYIFILVALKHLHADRPGIRRGVQAALVGLIILIAGLVSFRLFGSIAALLSGVLIIATGVFATYAQFTLTEIWATATLLAALAAVIVGVQRSSWRWLVGGGLLLGYSTLIRPQSLALPIVLAVYILFAGRAHLKRALMLAAVLVIASYGVIAPWTVRNYLRLHAVVPVASYSWYNFWEVNNPLANGNFIKPERAIPDQIREIRTHDEVQQDIALRRLAVKWVRTHPAQAAKGWVRDAVFYVSKPDSYMTTNYTLHGWRPPRLDDRIAVYLGLVSFALAMVVRRRWFGIGVFVVTVGYFLVFFSFFLPIARYRVALLPVLIILAAGLPEMIKRVIDDRRARNAGQATDPQVAT